MAAACTFSAPALAADYTDTNFHEDTIVGGLTIPTTAAWAPDGRVFIAEKSGLLKVLNPGESSATTILDISDQVNDAYDRGLLGLAVDTSFETNHYVYLLYTGEAHPLMADTDAPTFSRLVRIEVSGSNTVSNMTTLLGSETDCVTENFVTTWPSANDLDCIPSEGRSHSIGTVVSAPDGTLYVGSGDASSYAEYDTLAFRVYDQHSFAGKILHIDRNGNGLAGPHPFCSPDTSDLALVCTKIHSLGFRNPFRFKWRDDGTPDGELTIGDVGWNTREEVDRVGTPGHTYGWPCYEGTMHTVIYQDDDHCDGTGGEYSKEGKPDAHVPPVYDYVHSATNAIIGGPIYPGGPYPNSYDGQMFFGDYSAGFLKVLDFSGGGTPTATPFATNWGGVDLVLTPDSNIAFPDFGTGEPGTGSLKEIVYEPSTGAPHAVATASPIAGGKPLHVTFSAAGSTDPDGQALTYDWDFGDPSDTTPGTGDAPTHDYTNPGTYHATVTVEDPDGHTDSAGVDVQVFNSPPTPSIDSPADESLFRDGQTISLSGSATDAQDGPLAASALSWTVILHHAAHTHFVGTFVGTAHPSFTAQRDHDTNSYYEVKLRATDSDGEWRQTTIELRPEGVPFEMLSTPSGAPVSYSGVARTAPFSTSSAIGLRTAVSAGPRFTKDGKNWFFDSWADGGGRLRQIEIPDHATSLTARYLEDKAFGRPAAASTVQDDDAQFAAASADDDDPSTRWSSKGQSANQDPSPWWEVDLGSARSVSAVELDWEAAYASLYQILTSADHVHWSLAKEESIDGAIRQRTGFPVRKARWVRMQVLEHGSNFGASFFEARVLGPPDGDPVPVDKAAGQPASASSTQSSPALDPGRATDEDSATRWSSASLDGQWWQVDLGSLRTVDTVELNWETAYASSYRLETSGDGAHFAPAATENISSPGLRRTTFAARAARFVRIRALTRATAFGISLWDARVYGGSDPGPDGTPPDTTMDSGPSGPTNAASPTFGFSANEPGSWFECRIDGGGWGECSAPHTAGPLADGGHSFDVRATDPAGNPDPTPASRSFTVDTTAPDTRIDGGPSGSTTNATATFDLSANEPSTFECRVDGHGWGVCPARYTTAPLPDGAHTLDVRATDPAGNVDPTPASRSWTITPTARSYTDVIIGTRGLLGLWPLGDSGTRAADLAKGHRGRYSGGPARTGALIQIAQDGARRFDGANDRLLVPAGAIGKPASTTVELWVQPGRGGGRKRGIVLTDSRVPLHDGFTLYLDARRRPVFAVDGKRGRRGTVTGPAMKAGRTYLLGASYDGKRLAIFVNGVQRATRSYRGGIDYAGGRSILVGGPAKGRSGGLAAYRGVLDELAVYGRALGAATLTDHFRLGTGSG